MTSGGFARVPDLKWTEVEEGVSIPVPPAEHPRLYLRNRDLPDLKRRTTHPVLKPIWEELLALREKNVQNRLEVDAARYLMTGDAELGRRTIAEAIRTLEQANYARTIQDVTRPIGRMMVTGSIVYDWCYRLLTAEQKQAFQAQLIRLAKELECGYPPREPGVLTGHTSEWMILRDMLSAGVALYDEYPDMYRHAARLIFKLFVPARNWWYLGHAFHQGSSYAETRFVSDMYPLWIFERLGAGNIFHPAQQFVPYQWIYIRRPDGQLLRAGDGQSRAPKLRSLLNASYYGDGYVLSDYLKTPGIDPMNKMFEFLWRDPDLEPRSLEELPLSRYMGSPYGYMVARTGWGPDSIIAEMKVNIYNFGNHQHLDAGAFQIYHKGPLAIDSGLYEGKTGGYDSPHHVNYHKRTISHNTLLVYDPAEKFIWRRTREMRNDGGQKWPNEAREPRNLEYILSNDYQTGKVLGQGFGPDPQRPDYTYLKGDITQAYSAKVKEVKRSFVFLNLKGGPAPGALIVLDRITSSNPEFKKCWLLHTMEEPAIEGNSTLVSLSERSWTGRLRNTTLLPEPANTEIVKVGGPGKEYWVFGENFPNEPRRGPAEDFELGSWRIEISPRKPVETDLLLNVMQMSEAGREKMLPVSRIDSDQVVGARLADRVVLFGKSGERTDRPVAFSVKGAGTLKYLVTDLAEGTWQVRRDGRVVQPAVTVSADSGTTYFEGPAGTYELRR
jgi:heparin/heparan-sulfate lyase